ncbi:MAG: CcmD family protein [Ignavibacteria bacterium]|nr:CcmD family protein [Ignavibacteria bacterium]
MINFLVENQLYIVLIIVLIVWIGLFVYLLTLDKNLSSLERQINTMLNNRENKK